MPSASRLHTKARPRLTIYGSNGYEISAKNLHITVYIPKCLVITMCTSSLQVVHRVINALKDDIYSPKLCSLVAKSWRSEISRQWFFEAVVINSLNFHADLVHTRSLDLLPGACNDNTVVLVFTRAWE